MTCALVSLPPLLSAKSCSSTYLGCPSHLKHLQAGQQVLSHQSHHCCSTTDCAGGVLPLNLKAGRLKPRHMQQPLSLTARTHLGSNCVIFSVSAASAGSVAQALNIRRHIMPRLIAGVLCRGLILEVASAATVAEVRTWLPNGDCQHHTSRLVLRLRAAAVPGCMTAAWELAATTAWPLNDASMHPEELLRSPATCGLMGFLRRCCVACAAIALTWALLCTHTAATVVHGNLAKG